jgi:hypothetical protein
MDKDHEQRMWNYINALEEVNEQLAFALKDYVEPGGQIHKPERVA